MYVNDSVMGVGGDAAVVLDTLASKWTDGASS